MRYYSVEKLGPKRALTPEGYLVCYDVPIARTGMMEYAETELSLPRDKYDRPPDGIYYVTRRPEEVFAADTIASFMAKPVTDEHPSEFLDPENWRRYARGTVQNVRPGNGADADLLLADLLVTDAATIAAIDAGIREVSCGYDAEYEQVSPGNLLQTHIIGNHVALVENGRCGDRCSIGDSQMTKRTWRDRVRTAFKANDSAALDEALEQAEPGAETTAGGVHVHLHTGGEKPDDQTDAAGDPAEAEQDPVTARLDKIEAAVAALAETVGKIVAGEKAEAETATDEDPEEAEAEKLKPEGGTMDSAAKMREQFSETVALAEILHPGIVLPTYDAAAGAKKTADTLCLLRRRTLAAARRSGAHTDSVKKYLAALNPAAMSCDAVTSAFLAAAGAVKDAARLSPKIPVSAVGRPSLADMNRAAREFWATH